MLFMKMKFKTILVLISIILLTSLGVSAQDMDNPNQIYLKDFQNNQDLINSISNGSDDIVGSGVPFEEDIKFQQELKEFRVNEDDIEIKWNNGGINHTHQFLVARAIKILENDIGKDKVGYYYQYTSTLLENADWPDKYENNFFTFLGHFYDPRTKENYLGGTSPTAMTNFKKYANMAVEAYKNNEHKKVNQYLGRALHYLGDANVHHHAENKVAILSDHTKFEKWVDENRENYITTSTDRYPLFNYSWNENLEKIIDSCGYGAIGFIKENKVTDYHLAASQTMDNSQQYMAVFLYKFLQEVGEIE